MRFDLPLRFEKQLWLLQNPLPDTRRSPAPGGIELPGFTQREAMPDQSLRHAPTVGETGARHGRQKLYRCLGRYLSPAHLLLHTFRKKLDQPQPPRHPTRTAIQSPRQILHSIAKTPLQFRQQPALLQRRLPSREMETAIQHHRLGFPQRPYHSFHRVPSQLLQRSDALVAVDDQVTIPLPGHRHHHDRSLLTAGGQRS